MLTQELLDNGHFSVLFNEKGGLAGLMDAGSRRNFISEGMHPLYRIVLSSKGRKTAEVTSLDALNFRYELDREESTRILRLYYTGHGEFDLNIICTVSLGGASRLSRWRIEVENKTVFGIRTLEYPVVITPSILGQSDEDDYYVSGRGFGLIAHKPRRTAKKRERPGEAVIEEAVLSTDFCGPQYPGPVIVQMHTFYDSTAGLYMAAYDSDGNIKTFDYYSTPDNALDFTIHHHYDERPGLSFKLPYETVMGVFHGDWYTAADIYKEWAYKQHWCSKKLIEREDVPEWFKEPRGHMLMISRGGFDRVQATLPCPPSEYPLGRYWPLRKLTAQMKKYREVLAAPLVAWVEGWEQYGSPAGPVDIFPPLEGEESFKAAVEEITREGFPVQLYLAAFHWCYRRASTGYYGEKRFNEEGKRMCAVNPDGLIDRFIFTCAQKHFANICVGNDEALQLFKDNFSKLLDYGATWLQMDQQVGLYSPVCYSEEHQHPAGYGRWMYEKMLGFIREVRQNAKKRNPAAAFSCENACEIWIQEIDSFMDRPYLLGDKMASLPVFSYIYHEYGVTYGGDVAIWLAHPEVSCIKHAYCCIYGNQNLISMCEPDYDPDLEEFGHPVLPLLKNILKAQRTFARDYLVFGQMQRPVGLEARNVPIEYWCAPGTSRFRFNLKNIPLVLHSTWKDQSGKTGHVLVNWSSSEEPVVLKLQERNREIRIISTASEAGTLLKDYPEGELRLAVPGRAVVLVEQA